MLVPRSNGPVRLKPRRHLIMSWFRQIGVRLAGRVQRDPDDFTPGIDRAGSCQLQRSVSGDQAIEVKELPVPAYKSANDAGIRIRRDADDLSRVVDAEPKAERVIVDVVLDGAQILHPRRCGPNEGMRSLVTSQV
jgi:hypothetical protein